MSYQREAMDRLRRMSSNSFERRVKGNGAPWTDDDERDLTLQVLKVSFTCVEEDEYGPAKSKKERRKCLRVAKQLADPDNTMTLKQFETWWLLQP